MEFSESKSSDTIVKSERSARATATTQESTCAGASGTPTTTWLTEGLTLPGPKILG